QSPERSSGSTPCRIPGRARRSPRDPGSFRTRMCSSWPSSSVEFEGAGGPDVRGAQQRSGTAAAIGHRFEGDGARRAARRSAFEASERRSDVRSFGTAATTPAHGLLLWYSSRQEIFQKTFQAIRSSKILVILTSISW